MNQQDTIALALRRAIVRAESRALSVASIQIRQESRDAIKASKAILEQSRIELARLRVTRALVLGLCLRHAESDAALSSADR
jgi:hypothetical protein